jgi:hypothetical protein
MDFERFLELLRALAREEVEYVLVGGVALNLHGLVRATEDVDLFVRPDEAFVIDLLARLGTAFTFDDLEAQTVEIEGVPARVATPATLYRMKRDTARPIDRADAAALREKFRLGGA